MSRHAFQYAVLRAVPRIERGEFVNVGVIVSSDAASFLAARMEPDVALLQAIDADLDLSAIEAGLAAIPAICAGGAEAGAIGRLPLRERFHWLVAPRSTCIQTSAVHTGRAADLASAIETLLARMVRRQRTASGFNQPPPHPHDP